MQQVDHENLGKLIDSYYSKKLALFIYGRFGIGKSALLSSKAKQIALAKNKKFINWGRATEDEKKLIFANPKDYFVFIDIRLSEYDSSDIKGLPVFKSDQKSIEFKVPYWALLLEHLESDGILFFDEINLAPPLVMSSCYKIIYDRVVNESKINDNWGIFGAGNLDEDRAYTNSIAPPLKDRGGEVELISPSVEKWTIWAAEHNVDPRVIGFLNFKNGAIYKVDFNDKQKFTTPRGWERLSTLINDIPYDEYENLSLICSSAISEGIAKEFVAYCLINKSIDLAGIIAHPERYSSVKEINIKWFITSAVAEQYSTSKLKVEKVIDISKEIDKAGDVEFVAYLWKLCSTYDKSFKNKFMKKVDDDFILKYTKYLVN